MKPLATILFFLPFVLPVVLQIILGIKNIKLKNSLKVWQITLISIGVLLVGAFILYLRIRQGTAITHDGMAYIGLIILSLLTLVLILCIMGVQYIVKYRRVKADKLKTHQINL